MSEKKSRVDLRRPPAHNKGHVRGYSIKAIKFHAKYHKFKIEAITSDLFYFPKWNRAKFFMKLMQRAWISRVLMKFILATPIEIHIDITSPE